MIRVFEQGNTRDKRAIFYWGMISLLPLIPFTLPLFQLSLSDSPRAYLVWIPVLSVAWGAWNLMTNPSSSKAGSISAGTRGGLVLAVFVVCLVTFGKIFFPTRFFQYDIGLACWPLWTLAMFWMMFGVSQTRRALLPVIYMFLSWPVLYEGIIAIVNPMLASIALSMMRSFSNMVSWLQVTPAREVFNVSHRNAIVHLHVTSACSGSDTILAILVIFPIMLVLFRLSLIRKVLLVLLGGVLAFVFNLIRIVLIVVCLHFFGYHFALDILHPVLGTVFFILIIGFLLFYGSKTVKTVTTLWADNLTQGIAGPLLSLVLTVTFTAILVPLYFWGPGSGLRPVTLSTDDLHALTEDVAPIGASLHLTSQEVKNDMQVMRFTDEDSSQQLQVSLFTSENVSSGSVSLPPGIAGKVQTAHLIAHSRTSGITTKTYVLKVPKVKNGAFQDDQYLVTVTNIVGVYNYHRVYLKTELFTETQNSRSLSSDAKTVVQNNEISAQYVASLLHGITRNT